MSERNYTKAPDGTTLITRPRSPRECSEIYSVKGPFPKFAVDKDASTFPLATPKAIIASLRTLYSISKDDEIKILLSLKKVS